MSSGYRYKLDQELPDYILTGLDYDGSIVDFSSGWTFTVKIALATAPTAQLATPGTVTGAATSPNLRIGWGTSAWAGLTAGDYVGLVYCRRTADSKDLVYDIDFVLEALMST